MWSASNFNVLRELALSTYLGGMMGTKRQSMMMIFRNGYERGRCRLTMGRRRKVEGRIRYQSRT